MTAPDSFVVSVSDGFNTARQTVHLNVIACGDINNDLTGPDLSDLIYLVNYLFNGGPEPVSTLSANVNGLGEIDLSDLIYLVNYLFSGGPAPTCGL